VGLITIDGYPLDLVEVEEHSLESEITDHPVEDGSDISDNIRIKPRELTLTNAVVSDTPIGAIATDPTRILVDDLPPPSMDAYRKLEQIWLNREPVTIVTNLKKYDSMGLLQLTIPREAKNAGGLIFTAHFKEIRLAKNKRVRMAVPNAGGEANRGLSIDNIADKNHIFWQKGAPPGTSPATVPPGKIVGEEIVTVRQKPGHTKLLHPNGKELTDPEFQAFKKDLDREIALTTRRGLARGEQDFRAQGTVVDRFVARDNYITAHPGAYPDPSQFGLQRDPKTNRWVVRN
jgi:hypothetical protein